MIAAMMSFCYTSIREHLASATTQGIACTYLDFVVETRRQWVGE